MRSLGTTLAGVAMAAILAGRAEVVDGVAIPDLAAFRICFLVGACAAVAGALTVLLVPARSRRAR